MRKRWLAGAVACLALSVCSPAHSAVDLVGNWVAHPTVEGREGAIGLILSLDDQGSLSASLVMPPIGAWDIPMGPAEFSAGQLTTRLGVLVYDQQADTLSGALPQGLVPVHDISVVFRRTDRLAPPGEPPDYGPVAEPVWRTPTAGPVYGSPLVHDSTVYGGSDDGFVYALDAASGTVIWKSGTGGAVRARPALAGDRLYVPSDDGQLYCLDARSGETAWKARIGASPAPRSLPGSADYRYDHFASGVRIQGDRLFVGTLDGEVLALDPDTGREKWRFAAGDAVVSTPAINQGSVVVGSFDNHVYRLEADTGKLLWKFDTGAPVVSSPAIHEGLVIIGSRSYDLFGLNVADGSVRWRFYYWFSWVESSATVREGVAYVGSSDAGMVYAIDAVTGREIWSFDTAGSPWGAPAVTGDRVFIGSVGVRGYFLPHEPGFYAIDRETGRPAWWYPVEHPEDQPTAGFVSSPATDGERVYVGGLDGNIYAFAVRPDDAG